MEDLLGLFKGRILCLLLFLFFVAGDFCPTEAVLELDNFILDLVTDNISGLIEIERSRRIFLRDARDTASDLLLSEVGGRS